MQALRHVTRRLLLAACLAAALAPAPAAADPDGFNKSMLSFNQWFLRHVMEPVGRGWNFVVPKFFQRRVVDFMSNTEEPRDVINSMLQWKPRRAGIHMGRFLLNSTAGIGGFYDVSTRNLGFVAPPETVDETFGVWRIPRGPYFILPVVGEFTARSFVGWVGDGFLNPISYITGAPVLVPTISAYVVRNVNLVAQTMPSPWAPDGDWVAYEQSRFEFKPYEVGRELYLQDQADRVAE
jgi:phospholipid-binding lipoprotein MlaA